ncbi:MAG: hypothetical protein JO093_12305 [Acidobacteria bacterium]|nr:hypothetical protein [Acidobacteriota bacterium]MBV9068137.1 hypothetical protein [Acidobacteriota bacterium]MBV9186399.1 hypothetical protein [Acidobacteriota bacterium]
MTRLPSLATLLLALLALPAHALDLGGNWTKSETRNLIVYSNAHDFTTKAIVAKLERMRGALGHIMGLRTESAVPTTIFVFDGEPAFAPVRNAAVGSHRTEVVGFFTSSEGRFFVAMENDGGAGGDHVVFHEITHSLIENTAAGLPLWYQEGVAEFYSTFTVKGKSVVVGSIPKAFVDTILETGLMPLRRVFAIDTRSPEYNGAHAGPFYATSWIFMHYLLVGAPQRAGQLATYLALLDAKKPVDVAFQTAFGTTPEQFQGELWSYVNRPKLQVVSYTFPDLNAISVPAPVPVESAEVGRAFEPMLPQAAAK